MSLYLKKLRYKNFLSSGNEFTEFDFVKNKTTLVIGNNGSGKSTFIDALVFGLYGRAYRKINKPQLVNSINQKNLLVEVELVSNNKEYLIRRGVRPAIFEVFQGGNLISQDSKARDYQESLEENILKIGFKAFSQIVVLGSAQHIPFMQLSANARREIIEDLLDIQIFSVMNNLLKERLISARDAINENDMNLKIADNNIEMTRKHIKELETNFENFKIEQEIKKNALKEKIEKLQLEKSNISDRSQKINEKITELNTRDVKGMLLNLVEDISKSNHSLSQLEKEIEFFRKNDSCPTCKRELDETLRTERLDSISKKKDSHKQRIERSNVQRKKVEALVERFDSLIKRSDELRSRTKTLDTLIKNDELQIKDVDESIQKMLARQSEQHDNGRQLKQLVEEKEQLVESRKALLERRELMIIASSLLKDGGIKTIIIKQYVPIINQLIQKYLAAMDFYIQFQLDENFNETILSRYRDEFSYESFSEGEKFRIDLSLLFTWRAIAKLRNSATCNLLIFDELFDSSLDAAGTEDFLKIMDSLTADTNVFIISHRLDTMVDKFDNVIRFKKEKNFSKITKDV